MSDQWLSLDDLETALPAIAAAGAGRRLSAHAPRRAQTAAHTATV
jgi:hypothetical protein